MYFLGIGIELLFAHHTGAPDLAHHRTLVTDGLDDIAGAGFTFGADESGAFRDAAQRFSEIPRAADEGDLEVVLVDMVLLVSGSEDLGFIDIVYADGLKDLVEMVTSGEACRENCGEGSNERYLCFHKVPNADFCHDRNSYGIDDLLYHLGIALSETVR